MCNVCKIICKDVNPYKVLHNISICVYVYTYILCICRYNMYIDVNNMLQLHISWDADHQTPKNWGCSETI